MSAEPAMDLFAPLKELAAAVELLEVRPMGLHARLIRVIPAGTLLAVNIKNELMARQEGHGQFIVQAIFTVNALSEGDSREEFLEIRYDIISRYRVPPEHPLGQEVLDFFARTNGMVHLWPYLRAFVANSCAQMGVLPITLPPFRVQRAPEKPVPGAS